MSTLGHYLKNITLMELCMKKLLLSLALSLGVLSAAPVMAANPAFSATQMSQVKLSDLSFKQVMRQFYSGRMGYEFVNDEYIESMPNIGLDSVDSDGERTVALFPDAFEFTEEMGWIPEGWSVSDIGTEFNAVGGGTPSTKNPAFWEDGSISWTTPKDLSGSQSKILLQTDRKITELGLKKISSGLLPVNTVLMSSRAPVGYLALAKVPVAINQGYIALKCEKTLTPEFAIQWLDSIMDEVKQRAGGTTFAEISKTNFRGIPVFVPDKIVIDSYSQNVRDLYNQITSRIENIDTLAKLRDTLLPKLLSGELRIPDAAALVQDA